MGVVDEICWYLGVVNIAYHITKTDSTVAQSLQLLMHSGNIHIDLPRYEERRNDRYRRCNGQNISSEGIVI